MLAESSGIVMRQIVYTGAGDQEVGGVGHVDCVVIKLLEKYKELGHSVYMDNYFDSVNLVRQLKCAKLHCTGTLRKNRRNNPKDVTEAKLRRNEYICRWTDDGICVLKWKDKRDILMISSEHGAEFTSVKSRRGTEREKPNIVLEYNKYMGGIDNLDQMLAYYPCDRKTLKWYKKLAIHFFQIIMVNSFKLFDSYSGTKKTLSEFRLEVIGELVSSKESLSLAKRIPENFFHFPKYPWTLL
ncbi:hypothetical protein J437_LFUL015976 [Ladona fulva]|uniref:PiggyBac transposable element-derived protein domain-containing protein n=1 Tax=Ladona fulva TaxID=123851 RepID=A0A8K0KSF3_LADFU|nr:hypothetical protein J437_LFUL015976 [Ladona fulva]